MAGKGVTVAGNGDPGGGEGGPGEIQRIVLAGFMGSGKSTVGRTLARRLGWEFADLDACIEARLGLSVPQIFARDGEDSFRTAEVTELTQLLCRPNCVIALGGGAPGTSAIRDMLARSERTVVVHLRAPFAVLYKRCCRQAAKPNAVARPLLGDPLLGDTEAAAHRRYRERLDVYAAVAHCAVDADAGPPSAVADAILRQLEIKRPFRPPTGKTV